MKPAKQQSVGVEVTRESVRIVALDKSRKPVYFGSFPLRADHWAVTVNESLTNVFGKKTLPKRWAVALAFASQQTIWFKPSVNNPDLTAYEQWLLENYTGLSSEEYIADSVPVAKDGKPSLNLLALRRDEGELVKNALLAEDLRPLVLDSSLIAAANAGIFGNIASEFILLKLDGARSSWLTVRENALQFWGDFSVSSDPEDPLWWAQRLQEKLQELRAKWPGRPVYLCGDLLEDPTNIKTIADNFSDLQFLNLFGGAWKTEPAVAASFAAAMAMALRAGEQK